MLRPFDKCPANAGFSPGFERQCVGFLTALYSFDQGRT
jgi:hypothetical protein